MQILHVAYEHHDIDMTALCIVTNSAVGPREAVSNQLASRFLRICEILGCNT